MLAEMQWLKLGTTASTGLLLLASACSEPERPPDVEPRPEHSVQTLEPACAGMTMVEHEGNRVPELLLTLVGDDTAGVRLEMYFGDEESVYITHRRGSDAHLSWTIDRAQGPGHWDLDESRARVMELAPEAEADSDVGGYGEALRMDLGERAEGHLHFEQIRRHFGADTASLHCVAPAGDAWGLTVGRARALRMFPRRVPEAALDAIDETLPITELSARPRLISLSFSAERPLDAPPVVTALRASGFSPSGEGATLRSPNGIEAEVEERSLAFSAVTIGDAFFLPDRVAEVPEPASGPATSPSSIADPP